MEQQETSLRATYLGSVQEQLGRSEAAMASYQRAVALDRSNVLARSNLAAVMLTRGGMAAEALMHAQEALKLDSSSELALVNAGVAAMTLKKYSSAVGYLQRALAVNPNCTKVR